MFNRSAVHTLVLGTFFLWFSGNAQTANFTYSSNNGLFCSPVTVDFVQRCTGTPLGFTWSFGNGAVGNAPNQSILFSTAGSYTVKLTAIFTDKVVENEQTIIINPNYTISLSSNKNYICKPGNIDFTAEVYNGVTTYNWDFGDGAAKPRSTSPNETHNYTSYGNFTATVKTTDSFGCSAASSKTINIQNIPIIGNASPVNGCAPAGVTFASVITLPTGSSITNSNWFFGDGNTVTNTSTSVSHNYTTPGNYSPSLSITSSEGCKNTYNFSPLAFGIPPTGTSASATKQRFCGSENSIFNGSATSANSYFWDFGDGTNTTTNGTTMAHRFTTLGAKTISLTPFYNGCAGATESIKIDIVGVIAGFNYANTCSSKKTFDFTNISQGNISSYNWTFGDGATNNTANARHTFPPQGSFITNLMIIDDSTACVDSFAATLYTATPTLVNPDISICKNSSTMFTIANPYSNANLQYSWNVLGQVVNNNTNPLIFDAGILGNFTNNFITINNGAQNCLDTIYLDHSILVRGPNLSFTAPISICSNDAYNILNTSTAYVAADNVKLWYWNYGKTSVNDTIYQPQANYYPNAGIYDIKLVGIDVNGCKDSLIKAFFVNPIPFLRIFPRNLTLCAASNDTLVAFHSDNFAWLPSINLSCIICDTTIARPDSTMQYIGTATNVYGCTINDTSKAMVFSPFKTSISPSNPSICLNDLVQLSASPAGKIVVWTPAANLSNITSYRPTVSPTRSTIYKATLSDSMGCYTSSDSVMVQVKSLPKVDAGADRILPYNSTYLMAPTYSSDVASYSWTPSTLLNCSNCAVPQGLATYTQNYVLTVVSDSNCTAKDDVTIFVECKEANIYMPTAFTPNNDGKNDYYFPLARGISNIVSFSIYSRFGQLIFQNKNFPPNISSAGWDGKFNGQLQASSSYIFILEAICDVGETIIKKGSFVLIK